MNVKSEDFPPPVSPTRRIVYGLFALFLDILRIPCLRDAMSLDIPSEIMRHRCYQIYFIIER